MKVGEVREKLKEYDQAALIEMFVAAYKLLPKYAKETEMDPIIQNGIPSGKERKAKQEAPMDFADLEAEILEFVEDAYQQNYFIPNRKIPKSKRPKWRFMVKDYMKKLQKIPERDEHFERSCELLLKLYSMLCYGCSYYIFSTDDPFRSVGITQAGAVSSGGGQNLSDRLDREKCPGNDQSGGLLRIEPGMSA